MCAESGQKKQRIRRSKSKEEKQERRDSELEFMVETFLQQLHSLAPVKLQEPDVTLLHSIVPVKGATVMTGRAGHVLAVALRCVMLFSTVLDYSVLCDMSYSGFI